MYTPLQAGSVLAERFRVEVPVGSGGMGTVYRADDLETGHRVALKLLHSGNNPDLLERFWREARLLAELRHPNIVQYIAHGLTEQGSPYLAMEWLEGEDLAERLRRGRLTLEDGLTLLRVTAEALAAAHQRGVIHRDLKPSNLFLRGGVPAQAALLDFGIARRIGGVTQMTRTGVVIGTPEYMAPEQARGVTELTPAVDIFALGCLLYECLSGQPPFRAEHIAAVLAKILFDEPPPLRSLNTEVPESLSRLCHRMLSKDPLRRPRDATALLAELTAVQTHLAATTLNDLRVQPEGTHGEQGLISIILATPPLDEPLEETMELAQLAKEVKRRESLSAALAELHIPVEWTADGSLVAPLHEARGEAKDQVERAVRGALLVRERWPTAVIALATGRGQVTAQIPVGEALDRAGQILRSGSAPKTGTDLLLCDEVTAALLDARYVVSRTDGVYTLSGEVADADVSRPVLGQPTPCVGREMELGVLDGTLTTCIEESAPGSVLVLGSAGLGKSRLRHEFLRRLEQRGTEITIMSGRGEALSAGSPFGILAKAVRRLCGIGDSEPIADRRAKLLRRAACVPAADAQRVAEFLGELAGVPFDDKDSVQLRAARKDPRLLSDQIKRAWIEFMRAECEAQPVLLILEDLHWGDALTVKLCDLALHTLTESPLMVLGLGRPEVPELFPGIWAGHVQTLTLHPLGRRAAERLAQRLLASRAPSATVARVIELAAGSPLMLEELIRAAVEGQGNEAPRSVMAMLQARIGQLEPAARRALRNASVFGQTFWLSGIAAVQSDESLAVLEQQLELLRQRELVEPCADSRYPGEQEYRFRHALMCDAAYSLLTDAERRLAHLVAGRYLEQHGESDPLLLGQHAKKGEDLARAIVFFTRASELALESNDLTAALRHAQTGIECGAVDEARGELESVRAAALLWRGELQASVDAGKAAMRALPRGGRRWCKAAHTQWFAATYLAKADLYASLLSVFRDIEPEPDALSAYVEAASFLIVFESLRGRGETARFYIDRVLGMCTPLAEQDAATRWVVQYARGVYCHWVRSDLWQKRELARDAITASDQIGDRRMRVMATTSLAMAEMGLGELQAGTRSFREAMELVAKLPDETYLLGSTTAFFAQCLVDVEDEALHEEVVALSRTCIGAISPSAPAAGIAHVCLARASLHRGDLEAAAAHARIAVKTLAVESAVVPIAYAALARVLLQKGELAAAEAACAEGLAVVGELERCSTEVELRLAAAEVRYQAGADEAAATELRTARERLDEAAALIPDAAARERYLTQIPLHARVRKLAAERLGDGGAAV